MIKMKRLILEGNEEFQKRKCAYFIPKTKGRRSYKLFFILFKYPFRDPAREVNQWKILFKTPSTGHIYTHQNSGWST